MATKAELIGQSLLRIAGGILTPDISVRWGEAETYLAMAVNYVHTGNYWLETKLEGEKTINPLLQTAFENIPILFSAPHKRYYSDLPKRVITISKGRALQMSTMCGRKCFPLQQSDEDLERFYGKYKTNISYQLEGVSRVWWYNLPPLIQFARSRQIVHVSDLNDGDEVLLPSDGDTKVVELMVGFLSGQEKEQKDTKEDGKDN